MIIDIAPPSFTGRGRCIQYLYRLHGPIKAYPVTNIPTEIVGYG
jgi:hypothetical protein